MRLHFAFAAALAIAILAACNGGGVSTPAAPAPAPTATPSPSITSGTAAVSVVFPGTAGSVSWVAPTMATLSISASVGGATPTSTSAPCVAPSCVVTLTLPPGVAKLTLTGLDAAGKTLSTATATATIVAGTKTALAPALNPVPAAVILGAAPNVVAVNAGGAVALSATVKDVDGNVIGAPATFAFALTIAGASGATLSAPAFTTSGQTVTATYPAGGPQQIVSVTVTGGTLSPSSVTSAQVAIVTARPGIVGSSFTYTGTLTQTIKTADFNTPPTTATVPPFPNQTTTYTSTQTVTVNATTAPAIDQHTVEVDAVATTGPSMQTTSDAILVYPNGGTGPLLQTALTWTQGVLETATTDATTYGSGNGTVDLLPEVAGQTWSNTAAKQEVVSSGDGRLATQTVNGDGSYTMSITGNEGAGTVTIQSSTETSSGTGTSTLPCGFYCYFSGKSPYTFTFETPTAGTPAQQQIDVTTATGKAASPGTLKIKLWYPLPAALWSDTGSIASPATIPPSCNVSASGSASAVTRTTTSLDTIAGTSETLTTQEYDVLGIGVVCMISNDTLSLYFDLLGIEGYDPYFYGGPTPMQVTTTTQILGLTASSLGAQAALRRPASLGATIVRPSLTALRALVDRQRRAWLQRPFAPGTRP